MRRWRWKRAALLAAALVAAWLGSSLVVAARLTARPSPRLAEESAPSEFGPVESFRLPTSDGEKLGAWFVAGHLDRPVVLLLHGNGNSRRWFTDSARFLRDSGFGLLIPTLRAHGDSTGDRNDFGLSARHDVVAAIGWLNRRCPGRSVVVLGQSAGAAAALFAAEELGHRVFGYILECPFQSLDSAVRNRTRTYLPVPFDVVAYCGLRVVAPLVLPQADLIRPVDVAATVPACVPVLVLAGARDSRATVDDAKSLTSALGARARLEVFPEGDHVRLWTSDPVRYQTLVLDFIAGLEAMRKPE